MLAQTLNISALTSDRDQPIFIQADKVEVNETAGQSHYTGNVLMIQGTLKIKADEIIVYSKQGKPDKILIYGKPASIQQQPDDRKYIVHSKAHVIEYSAKSEIILLKTEAAIQDGNRLTTADLLEYDTRKSTMRAKKDETGKGRVITVIGPDEPAEDKQPAPEPKPVP